MEECVGKKGAGYEGYGLAEDASGGAAAAIRPAAELDVVLHRQKLGQDWRGANLVGVQLAVQALAAVGHVGNLQHHSAWELALHRQVPLQHGRLFEVRIN